MNKAMSLNERCFRLYHVDGLSWDEVAKAVDKPSPNAARSAAFRWARDNPQKAATIKEQMARASEEGAAKDPVMEDGDLKDLPEGTGKNELSPNVVQVWSAGRRIRSIDDLLAHMGIDKGEWEIIRQEAGYYEGQQRKVEKDLQFDEGRITGYVKQDGAVVVPMFKCRVTLARKDPVAINPVIKPIVGQPVTHEAPPAPSEAGVITEVYFGDGHIGFKKRLDNAALTPFHDRRALDVMVQVIAYLQPDKIFNLGDWWDCAEFSDKFLRPPEFLHTMQPALAEGTYWNERICHAAPNAERVQFEGNHEARLRRLLLNNFTEGYQLQAVDELDLPPQMSIERLAAFHVLGIAWRGDYPDAEAWSYGTRLSHGNVARANPGATAWAVLKGADTSEAFGHIHRAALLKRTAWPKDGPKILTAFSPGCLCFIGEKDPATGKRRGPPGKHARQNWQKGFTVRQYVPGFEPTYTFVAIYKGRAVYNDRVFQGRGDLDGRGPVLDELQARFPKWSWSARP